MMYRSGYLYKNSRIQLKSCSAAGENKTEDSHTEISKKSNFTLLASASPSSQHSSMPRQNAPSHDYSLGGKVNNGTCLQCFGFLESCMRNWFLSHLRWRTDKTSMFYMSRNVLKQRKPLDRLLQPAQLSAIGKSSPTLGFSLRREGEEWSMCSAFQLLRGLLKRLVSVSPHLEH